MKYPEIFVSEWTVQDIFTKSWLVATAVKDESSTGRVSSYSAFVPELLDRSDAEFSKKELSSILKATTISSSVEGTAGITKVVDVDVPLGASAPLKFW